MANPTAPKDSATASPTANTPIDTRRATLRLNPSETKRLLPTGCRASVGSKDTGTERRLSDADQTGPFPLQGEVGCLASQLSCPLSCCGDGFVDRVADASLGKNLQARLCGSPRGGDLGS
jgi:hypothetical protein